MEPTATKKDESAAVTAAESPASIELNAEAQTVGAANEIIVGENTTSVSKPKREPRPPRPFTATKKEFALESREILLRDGLGQLLALVSRRGGETAENFSAWFLQPAFRNCGVLPGVTAVELALGSIVAGDSILSLSVTRSLLSVLHAEL